MNKNNNAPIGIFDSGVGGLTVAKEVMKHLPNENIVYLGDNYRCPYGSRTVAQVRLFTQEMVAELIKKDIKLLIIGCNTATALALPEITQAFSIPIIGVIIPGAKAGVNATNNLSIGIIGTTNTINSKAYEHALLKLNPNLKITALACPDLVPLIESNSYYDETAEQVIYQSIEPLLKTNIDTLILGCTHYALIKNSLQKILGAKVQIISSNRETAKATRNLLINTKLLNTAPDAVYKFYTTGDVIPFQSIVQKWLEIPTVNVNKLPSPKNDV